MFTGKGGVGKTSVAAATAIRAAARGDRVLVTSTDPAHSLADALDQPVGDHPTRVPLPDGGDLDAQQIDAQQRLERHWREVRDYLVSLLAWGGVGDVEAEELVLLPGLDELFALVDLRGQVDGGRYDLIVVDCAPTAETLRLLSLPDALRWYVDRVLGPGRRVARAVRPLQRARGAAGLPVPEDDVFGAVERVHADLAAVHEMLQDPARSSIRLVANPERLIVAETQRTATSLSLFGYAVDALVVNRMLPDEVTDPYLARWKQRQAEHLTTIRDAFAPTPVLTAPLFEDELDGVAGLAGLADALYGDIDERAVLGDGRPVTVVADGDDRVLRLALPFAARDEVDLHRRGTDLHLSVAGVRRTVALPAALQRREVGAARFVDGYLEIRFVTVDDRPLATSAGTT
ncbi:MAG: ArsA family ATPase [Nitriliruptor sp.]|uniref:ArsA family ATPase n=1 Tax=Nitriliruptor sp. TaxID=2448056 RepID=UPI0034A02896